MVLLTVIFLGVLVLSFAVLAFLSRPTQHEKTVLHRLGQLALVRRAEGAERHESQDILRPGPSGQFAWLDRVLARFPLFSRLQLLIEQANGGATPARLLLAMLGLASAGFILSHLFLPTLPLDAGFAVVAGSAPVMILKIRRARRLKAFNDALPDSIDLMSRALRAGHSLGSAIEIVGEEAQEPVAEEFNLVHRQQNFGLPFREALLEMTRRIPSQDLQFVITAMLVQKETGGNLTEILDRTSHVIRERLRIHGEVRIKTAQGRLTGWILSLLPAIMAGLISTVDPGYMKPLFHEAFGRDLLYAGAGMLVIGGLIIRQIVNIEV